jgi:tetratricopeptide (TPR) repeat protein
MNGTPQSTYNTLIEELNGVRYAPTEQRTFPLGKLKRDAAKLRSADAFSSYIISGVIASLEHDVERAKDFHQKSLRISPHNYQALYNYATSLIYCGKAEEAYQQTSVLVKLFPQDVNASLQHIAACSMLGRYSEAFEYAHNIIATNPEAETDGWVQDAIAVYEWSRNHDLVEDDIIKYCNAMLDVMEKNQLGYDIKLSVSFPDDLEIVRNIIIDCDVETLCQINNDLIELLSEIDLSSQTITSFNGYFIFN